MTEFAVNQRVTVLRDGRPSSTRMVLRIQKRFIELSDGSRWQPDGSGPYPRDTNPYPKNCYRLVDHAPEHAIAIRRARLVNRLSVLTRADYESLSELQLFVIGAALDAAPGSDSERDLERCARELGNQRARR